MRCRAAVHLPVVIVVLLMIWGIAIVYFNAWGEMRAIVDFNLFDPQPQQKLRTAAAPKCGLSRVCPPNHFALRVRSGVANVVGPQICFEGKTIMSTVLNNVGEGLNIVVVNEGNGVVEKRAYLNMQYGRPEEMLAYLKEIQPGRIVLAASFDDVTKKMTDEMREVFVGMGSTLIKSVRLRDNWVFVGRTVTGNKRIFEKQTVNDAKTNIYEKWPEAVEVGGCLPKTSTDRQTPFVMKSRA